VAKYSATGVVFWANRYGGIGSDCRQRGGRVRGRQAFYAVPFSFTTDFGGGLAHDRRYLARYLDKLPRRGAYQGRKALCTAGTIKGTCGPWDGPATPGRHVIASSVDWFTSAVGLLSWALDNIFLQEAKSLHRRLVVVEEL